MEETRKLVEIKKQEEISKKQNEANEHLKNCIKVTLLNGGRRFVKYYYNRQIPWNIIQDVNNELREKTDWLMTWQVDDVSREVEIGWQDWYKVTFFLNKKEDAVILPNTF